MISTSTAEEIVGPIEPERRLEAVDMVRGFALFGVVIITSMLEDLWSSFSTGSL